MNNKFSKLVISPEGLESIKCGKPAPRGAVSLNSNNKINWISIYLDHCRHYKPIKVGDKYSAQKTLAQFDTLAKNLTVLIANTGRSAITKDLPVFIPPLMQMYDLPYEDWDFDDPAMPYMLGNLSLYSSIKQLREIGPIEYDINSLRLYHLISMNEWKAKKYLATEPFNEYMTKLSGFQIHLLCKSWILHSSYDKRMISDPWDLDVKLEVTLFNIPTSTIISTKLPEINIPF